MPESIQNLANNRQACFAQFNIIRDSARLQRRAFMPVLSNAGKECCSAPAMSASSTRLPDQVCDKCWEMTGTKDGLAALKTQDGYEHYTRNKLVVSAIRGCNFCRLLSDHWSSSLSSEPIYISATGSSSSKVEIEKLTLRFGKYIPNSTAPEKQVYLDLNCFTTCGRVKTCEKYTNASLLINTDLDDPAATILNIEAPSNSSTLDLALVAKHIKARLHECQLHSTCPSQNPLYFPSRVIDVGFEGDPTCKLYISNSDDTAPYVALSYVWGVTQTFVASTETWLGFTHGFPVTALPEAIQDAVRVTRSIGIRYLWVDALCILQDSEADKVVELNTMGSIYRNSTLTISAACSQSAQNGFLRSYPAKMLRQNILLSDGTLGIIWFYVVSKESSSNNTPQIEPINSRAWTLQEALLSPRILYYASDGLLWNCQTIQSESAFILGAIDAKSRSVNIQGRKESSKSLIPRLPSSIFSISGDIRKYSGGDEGPDSLGPISIFNTWRHVVEDYSARRCTFAEDRLPALSGVASELAKTGLYGAYLAGLWQSKVILQLGWAVMSVHPESHDQDYLGKLSRLPSWSWASFPGRISFRIPAEAEEDALLKSYDISFVDSKAKFSKVTSVQLVLEALLMPWTCFHDNEAFISSLILDTYRLGKANRQDIFPDAQVLFLGKHRYGKEVYKEPVFFFLILQPVRPQTFKRMGFAYTDEVEYNWRHGVKRSVFTLI